MPVPARFFAALRMTLWRRAGRATCQTSQATNNTTAMGSRIIPPPRSRNTARFSMSPGRQQRKENEGHDGQPTPLLLGKARQHGPTGRRRDQRIGELLRGRPKEQLPRRPDREDEHQQPGRPCRTQRRRRTQTFEEAPASLSRQCTIRDDRLHARRQAFPLPQAPAERQRRSAQLQRHVAVRWHRRMKFIPDHPGVAIRRVGRALLRDLTMKSCPHGPRVTVAGPAVLQWADDHRIPVVILAGNDVGRAREKGNRRQHRAHRSEPKNEPPRPKCHDQQHQRDGPNLDEHRRSQHPRRRPPPPAPNGRQAKQDQRQHHRIAMDRPEPHGGTDQHEQQKTGFAMRRPVARQYIAHKNPQPANENDNADQPGFSAMIPLPLPTRTLRSVRPRARCCWKCQAGR